MITNCKNCGATVITMDNDNDVIRTLKEEVTSYRLENHTLKQKCKSLQERINTLEENNENECNDSLQDKIDKALAIINVLDQSSWVCFGRTILKNTLEGEEE